MLQFGIILTPLLFNRSAKFHAWFLVESTLVTVSMRLGFYM